MKRLVHEFKGHHETVCCCCFIPSSLTGTRKVIATTSNDCSIRLWDQDTKGIYSLISSSCGFSNARLWVLILHTFSKQGSKNYFMKVLTMQIDDHLFLLQEET